MGIPGIGGVVQPKLLITPDVQAGLDSGFLRITGGIAREVATGRIFAHLKEIAVPEKDSAGAIGRALQQVKNPRVAVPLGVVLVVSTVIGGAAIARRRSQGPQPELSLVESQLPESVTVFEKSLHSYVEAGREGKLDVKVVAELIEALDAMKAYRDSGNEVTFSLAQLEPLFGLVTGHTAVLAEAYSVKAEGLEAASAASDTIGSLRRHLEAQKTILENAA